MNKIGLLVSILLVPLWGNAMESKNQPMKIYFKVEGKRGYTTMEVPEGSSLQEAITKLQKQLQTKRNLSVNWDNRKLTDNELNQTIIDSKYQYPGNPMGNPLFIVIE